MLRTRRIPEARTSFLAELIPADQSGRVHHELEWAAFAVLNTKFTKRQSWNAIGRKEVVDEDARGIKEGFVEHAAKMAAYRFRCHGPIFIESRKGEPDMRQVAKLFPTKLHESNGTIFQLRSEDVLVVAYATAPFEYGNTPSPLTPSHEYPAPKLVAVLFAVSRFWFQ